MRAAKNLMFITLPLLVIFLVIVELLLRAFFPVSDPYDRFKNRYYNAFIPSEMPVNARYHLTSHEGLMNMDTATIYTTNNTGFRGDSLQLPKPSDEVRIFLIGGSTTQCLYIDDSKAINTVLQHVLQSHYPGRTLKVYAAAKSGDGSDEHLAMLSHRIIHMQPDVVIVFSGINDLRKSIQQYDYMHLKPAKSYLPRYIFLAATELQIGRRLYYMLRHPTDEELRETVPLETNYRQLFAIQQKKKVSDSVPVINASPYCTNLRSIAGICYKNNVKVVWVPNQSTWNKENMKKNHWLLTCGAVRYKEEYLERGLALFNDSMRKVAFETGVPLFNLPENIPPTEENFYDDCHFTAAGSIAAGNLIARFIINNNLLPASDSVSTFKYK